VVAQKATDDEILEALRQYSTVTQAARALDITERNIYYRLSKIEGETGVRVERKDGRRVLSSLLLSDARVDVELQDGVILVGSDAHYRPGEISTAHRAFVKFCKELKPDVVVMNGDVLDFPTVSRHATIGWENRPTVVHEIECAQARLGEIEAAAEKARRIWPLGNHDMRFESRIANVAPELARVKGVHLKDHFPLWEPCWAVFINDDVVIKHRLRGGIHATHNKYAQCRKDDHHGPSAQPKGYAVLRLQRDTMGRRYRHTCRAVFRCVPRLHRVEPGQLAQRIHRSDDLSRAASVARNRPRHRQRAGGVPRAGDRCVKTWTSK
jgi:hypothetical protein